MTKKEFKYGMERGLGSCILELERASDKERYKDIIVWGCKHELAYDAQSEGTRSQYLYQMIEMYEDWTDFYEAASSRLKICCSRAGWEFMQHAELCALMAGGGYMPAGKLLDEIYEYLFEVLSQRKIHSKNGIFTERTNMEALCIAKVTYQHSSQRESEQEYIKIVNDLGMLFQKNARLYSHEHFLWFQQVCEDCFGKIRIRQLLELYADMEDVESYWKSMRAIRWNQGNGSRGKRLTSADKIYEELCKGKRAGKDIPLSITQIFQNQGRQEEVQRLARLYDEEQKPSVRTELLKLLANRCGAEFLDVNTLINDTRSEQKELRQYAFLVLTHIRSEEVYAFALELLMELNADEAKGDTKSDIANRTKGDTKNDIKSYAVRMLLQNYSVQDEELVVQLVKSIPISRDSDEWHSVFRRVMNLFADRTIKKPPKELLPYMYANTLCSHCREYIVLEMGKRRMLTEELLEECRYDCNEGIRRFAEERER